MIPKKKTKKIKQKQKKKPYLINPLLYFLLNFVKAFMVKEKFIFAYLMNEA